MFGTTTKTVDTPTTDVYINEVLIRVPQCPSHNKPKDNQPCWAILTDKPLVVNFAICNRRVKLAGYNGDENKKA